MAKFTIQPHGRLQEMVAHELGFFAAEGLDYEIAGGNIGQTKLIDASGQLIDLRSGAYQSYERGKGNKGEKSDISCACHWTVNNAAANNIGTMYGKAYALTPGGIMVPEDSPIRKPEDLAGREIAVGYQSGSHYSTIQALEQYMSLGDIKLSFNDGLLFSRMELKLNIASPYGEGWVDQRFPKGNSKQPYFVELEPDTYHWCACGRSQNQPFCDGSHRGSNVRPIAFDVAQRELLALCGCKRTGTGPFCDGTHLNLKIDEKAD